jgi:hypothetical protein
MGRQISMATRRELVLAIRERYGAASRAEKSSILDEFAGVTGYHRKHAIRVLRSRQSGAEPIARPRGRLYDEAVRQALIVVWEASDRICSKRLKPLIPILIEAMERHGHLHLAPAVRERLLAVSAATIDRLLTGPRVGVRGRRRQRAASPIRRSVPVRTFADWQDPPPGYVEADLVAHCGESTAGSFVQSLALTDIASGWMECVPLIVREQTLVIAALAKLRATLPFPLRGLDTDNDSVFLNETVLGFCQENGIEFTRSRAYRKNDQAWIEQKNGAVVRRLTGYHRLAGVPATAALNRLYAASRLFVNFFQPSFKLASKERDGAKVRKRYHAPASPYQRLLASDAMPAEAKARLRNVFASLDPLRLLDEIRAAQGVLCHLASGREIASVERDRDAELDRFLKSLSTAWRDGEVRPTHRKEPATRRYWRTRCDPFEEVWPTVRTWLEQEPERTAKELFQRLQIERAGAFTNGQLRTLQRRVKAWRSEMARQLVFAGVELAAASSPEPSLIEN